eukprot:1144446-Pelagomonas_calceolata.AAC.6
MASMSAGTASFTPHPCPNCPLHSLPTHYASPHPSHPHCPAPCPPLAYRCGCQRSGADACPHTGSAAWKPHGGRTAAAAHQPGLAVAAGHPHAAVWGDAGQQAAGARGVGYATEQSHHS